MKAKLFMIALLITIALVGCTNSKSVSVAMVEDAVMPSTTTYLTHVDTDYKYGKNLASNGANYVIISLFTKNTSNQSITIDASNFRLTNGTDTYDPVTKDLSKFYQAINNSSIGPKVEQFGVVLFEVPESVKAVNDTLPGWKLLYENGDDKATFDLSERVGKLLSDE